MNYKDLNDLINKGLSSWQIAKQLKSSQTNVRYWLKKHNLKTNCKSFKGGFRPPKRESFSENGKTYAVCSQCEEKKEFISDNFYIKPDGRHHVWCKPCSNKKSVKRLRDYKSSCVEYKGGKCQSCGYTKCNRALAFHHIDPSKKLFEVNSNKMFAVSWQRVKDELDKCILLCSNCHAELHDQEILDKYQQI